MKTIILLFILVSLLSCVTADTGKRGLSGAADSATCMYDCHRAGGSKEECHEACVNTNYGTCLKDCMRAGGSKEECHDFC